MSRASFSSRFSSLFIRIFLLVSWVLLVFAFVFATMLAVYPNAEIWSEINDGNSFGVWKLTNNTIRGGFDGISIIGWVLLAFVTFSIIFSGIIILISKKVKFKIGTNNQILGYFSSIALPLIACTVFAFVGSLPIPSLTSLPIHGTVQSLFYTPSGFASLVRNSSFPLAVTITGGITFVYWIILAFAAVSAIGVVFTTIKMLFRALLSRTHDKN